MGVWLGRNEKGGWASREVSQEQHGSVAGDGDGHASRALWARRRDAPRAPHVKGGEGDPPRLAAGRTMGGLATRCMSLLAHQPSCQPKLLRGSMRLSPRLRSFWPGAAAGRLHSSGVFDTQQAGGAGADRVPEGGSPGPKSQSLGVLPAG